MTRGEQIGVDHTRQKVAFSVDYTRQEERFMNHDIIKRVIFDQHRRQHTEPLRRRQEELVAGKPRRHPSASALRRRPLLPEEREVRYRLFPSFLPKGDTSRVFHRGIGNLRTRSIESSRLRKER